MEHQQSIGHRVEETPEQPQPFRLPPPAERRRRTEGASKYAEWWAGGGVTLVVFLAYVAIVLGAKWAGWIHP